MAKHNRRYRIEIRHKNRVTGELGPIIRAQTYTLETKFRHGLTVALAQALAYGSLAVVTSTPEQPTPAELFHA